MINAGLRYFAAVARGGSIREAAEELHVAQSALSRQILKLEAHLGAPLFQRHARGVELTSAGEILLSFAQMSLRQVEKVRSEVDALKGLRRGNVHIHAIDRWCLTSCPSLAGARRSMGSRRAFQRRAPARAR